MGLLIDISVIPKARHQRCAVDVRGNLRIHLTSVPEKGRANAELIELLSSALRVPKNAITIVLGGTSRKKRISIDADVTKADVFNALGIEWQMEL